MGWKEDNYPYNYGEPGYWRKEKCPRCYRMFETTTNEQEAAFNRHVAMCRGD